MTNIKAPLEAKIGDVLLEYISVLGLDSRVLENNLYFIYNGRRIQKEDENKTVKEFIRLSTDRIYVLDY